MHRPPETPSGAGREVCTSFGVSWDHKVDKVPVELEGDKEREAIDLGGPPPDDVAPLVRREPLLPRGGVVLPCATAFPWD